MPSTNKTPKLRISDPLWKKFGGLPSQNAGNTQNAAMLSQHIVASASPFVRIKEGDIVISQSD